MPLWDLLHPGRPWTAKCQKPKMTLAELKKQVVEFLKK
jgi:hypothetical protein